MNITKGLTSTGNIVAETPKYLFDRISSIFNFSLDVCALPENAKCESYYTPEDDGLSKPWWGGGYGAILPMEEKSRCGSRKPMRSRRRNTTALYSCYFLQEPIQNGGGSMCRARRRSSSSKEE